MGIDPYGAKRKNVAFCEVFCRGGRLCPPKASLVQREVAKPEVLPEGLYSKRDCFFSGLPVKMQNLIVSNPSVSFADRSLYTRK